MDLESGKKYERNKKERELVKEKNDEVCREDGLCVSEGNGRMGYSEGEKGLIEKGKRS
nr:relaxase/mobilization nuclease domain-containing protein [Staphylococcus epidermidis]